MKLLWLLASIILAISFAIADEVAFKNFVLTHKKQYKDKNEELLRQAIFQKNLQEIEEHNKKFQQGLVTYELGVNQFADFTNEEFSAMFKTLPVEQGETTNNGVPVPVGAEVPQAIDWRDNGVVTEVKNQLQCGGCWAFSTTGAVESHWAIQTGQLLSLSEQQLIDCDTARNKGCGGGVVEFAITDYVDKYGLIPEANYSYVGYQRNKCRLPNRNIPVVKTKGYKRIISGDENDLKNAVGLVGCSQTLNHGVLAVGFGVQSGQNYWIIKNSWGKNWGENGYFRMAMGHNLCGITLQSGYPVFKETGNNANQNIASLLIFLTANIILFH